jgi:hypothetical protein
MIPDGALPIWGWAPGAQALDLPDVAGVPIGAGSSSQYALLQIHYNNPQGQSGQMDSSGVRMYYTSQLRPQNAGFFFLGIDTSSIQISPGYSNWMMSGTCPPTVTATITSPLNVFAVGSHVSFYRYGIGDPVAILLQ